MMKIRIEQFASVSAQLFLLLFVYAIEEMGRILNGEDQIRILAVLGIVLLVVSLGLVYYFRNKFDCYSILLVLIFCFMFGQQCLFLFRIYPKNLTILSGRVSEAGIYQTGFLVLKSIIMLNIGYFMNKNGNVNKEICDSMQNEHVRKRLYKAGCVFFAIAIVPTFIVLGRNIVVTFTMGYGERILNVAYKSSGIHNLAGIIASYMVPALFALFIARKPGTRWPVLAAIVYMILYTLSGSRINTMVLLIGMLYVQTNLFSKVNFKRTVKYAILLLLVFFIFSTVSIARNDIGAGKDAGKIIQESFTSVADNNVFVSVLAEAGYTFCATATVVDNCPVREPYMYGKSYLSGLVYVLPNGLTDNYYLKVKSTDEVFQGYLNSYGGIGSSFIAEAYWNFGEYALLLMLLYGIIIGRVCRKLDTAIAETDYLTIFTQTYIIVTIAFYVRSDCRTFFRNYIWFCLPVILVACFMKRKSYGRKNDEKRNNAYSGG